MNSSPLKRIFLSAPHMSGRELPLIEEAFETNYIAPAGPMIQRFERAFSEYVDVPYAVALCSGTAALHLALRLAGVKSGDEVWCCTMTFIGNVSPVTYLGANPVFLDASANTWNMDVDILADELAKANREDRLPAAIVPTDVFGQSCDMDPILALGEEYDVPVIFDSAESLGARYRDRHAGNGGKAAIFSFNGNKIITSSGGGMLVTHDHDLAEQARFLSLQARDDAPYYQHSTIGYNYRMSNIVAAIGLGQLQVIEERVGRRRAIFNRYYAALSGQAGLSFIPEASYGRSSRWLTILQIDPESSGTTSEVLRVALEKDNIETRPVWKPMHLQPVFRNARYVGDGVAETLFSNGLCIPSGSGLTNDDVDFVALRINTLLSP